MRYKDIADVRNRGRRESFGPRKRIAINDLRIDSRAGLVTPSIEASKAQRPMSERWLFTITRSSHPIARLWRSFVKGISDKLKPINAKRKLQHNVEIKNLATPTIRAKFPGWKSFKKRAHAEGNAKIACAMAR